MSDRPSLLDDAIEALGFAREGTIAEAANIPDDRWSYRPHPNARSVSELVRHVIQAAAMLVGEASDPEGDFTRRPPQEQVAAHAVSLPPEASPSELREALEATHAVNVSRIRNAGESHMNTRITRFDGGTWRRLTYVFYATSHEDYHRGQLAIYARSMGLVPALTQRIHGTEAK
jgi:uncharacterized damage-inducible protein DinB